jgi:hypothetical protein
MVQLINKGFSSCGSGSMEEPPGCALFSFFYFVPSANHPKDTTGRGSFITNPSFYLKCFQFSRCGGSFLISRKGKVLFEAKPRQSSYISII